MIADQFITTGHLSRVKGTVFQTFATIQKKHRHSELKVGVTSDSHRRFKEHNRKEGWKAMYLVYRTTSIDYARQLEDDLIVSFWSKVQNLRRGGAGYFPYDAQHFWVYILVS